MSAADWEAARSAWHELKGLFLELRSLDLLPSPDDARSVLGPEAVKAMASIAGHPAWAAEASRRPELQAMLADLIRLSPSATEGGAFARLCEIAKAVYPVCDRICS